MKASGLAAAVLCSTLAALPASAQTPTQSIELRSFSYTPATLHLAAGKPVTLAFVNRSGGSHDFTAKAFFAHSRMVGSSVPGGEIELKGGQSRSITLIPAAGRYKVHCGHFMHKQFGMTGEIIVQ